MSLAGFADDEAFMEARLGLVVLRLSVEVTRLRALRADGRRENFAGVLMSDADIVALCQELMGAGLPGLDDIGGAIVRAETDLKARAAAMANRPMLFRLRDMFGLDAVEIELLMLALAPALDARFGRVYGFLHEDMAQQSLTPGLAQRMLAGLTGGGVLSLRRALGEQARLRRYGFLDLAGDGSMVGRRIVMPDGVADLLAGRAQVPEGVVEIPCPGSARYPANPMLMLAQSGDPVLCAEMSGPLWTLRRQSDTGLEQAQLAGMMAALAGASIIHRDWDDALEAERCRLAKSLARHAVVVTRRPARWHGFGVAWTAVEPRAPGLAGRRAFWDRIAPDLAEILAGETVQDAGTLWQLALEAHIDPDPAVRLRQMIRYAGSDPMQGLADRVVAPFDFDDLVLPDSHIARLKVFAARRRSAPVVLEDWGLQRRLNGRPGGIALFLGPSGTGKTMSASVVARGAGLDLWRINLATVVSKYIGETESNLEKIFSAAGEAEVMLFFDEAEALFSKRAEVRDARDRYANMEMSYLLQRLEGFPGMAVLASNMGAALDPALQRRFDLVLEFPVPDAAARRRIWAAIDADGVPLAGDVDLDLIAERFELSGGHIRQAILSAAHEAAQSGEAVGQRLLLQSVAREYVKLGRTLRREAFGDHFAQIRGQV